VVGPVAAWSTIACADTIVVMRNGGIAERGTHEELVLRSALYRELLSGQLARAGGAG
jgi:ATP-binding cassette subfamily B protein